LNNTTFVKVIVARALVSGLIFIESFVALTRPRNLQRITKPDLSHSRDSRMNARSPLQQIHYKLRGILLAEAVLLR